MRVSLTQILRDVRAQIVSDQRQTPLSELVSMIPYAPPVRDFEQALRAQFRLIAEIKRRSPSVGAMLSDNVDGAAETYEASPLVGAVSVLTNAHFGMTIEDLADLRGRITKPILRKEFILDPYQIYQARAYGADAVLLMGNLGLPIFQVLQLWATAQELGLSVLFESHTLGEIQTVPPDARIYGINSRQMDSPEMRTDTSRFELIQALPSSAIKVAESGITSSTVAQIRDQGFNAALVGTYLLTDTQGIQAVLDEFSLALHAPEAT